MQKCVCNVYISNFAYVQPLVIGEYTYYYKCYQLWWLGSIFTTTNATNYGVWVVYLLLQMLSIMVVG